MVKKSPKENIMTEVTDVTTEEAREVLQQELSERAQECAEQIQEILAEHSCSVDISLTINGRGHVSPNFNIVANPR